MSACISEAASNATHHSIQEQHKQSLSLERLAAVALSQYSELLLTSGNREPRVTPDFPVVCGGLSQPTKVAHRGTVPLQEEADD